MNTIQKRFLLFLGGCIPVRLAMVLLAKYIPLVYLPWMETFGQPIWWRPFRIIHGLFYLIFSLLAIYKYANAYLVLLFDTLIGLGLFLWHHYTEGNFDKLF